MTVLYYITLYLLFVIIILLSTITYFLAAVSFILLQSVLLYMHSCVSRLVQHISFSVYTRAIIQDIL